jgi:hypothetical protein
MALSFKDFLPEIKKKGFFNDSYEPLRESLRRTNDWIDAENPEVINVETVVLPNVHDEEGNEDPDITTSGERRSTWHQFIRVWYKV